MIIKNIFNLRMKKLKEKSFEIRLL